MDNPTVTFATFCHPPHLERLHLPGVLEKILASHKHQFDEVLVVHQRCEGLPFRPIKEVEHRVLRTENYPNILSEYGLPEEDRVAEHLTHGPKAPHYWKWHCINHLIALKEATSDYIVFSDCDCLIVRSPDTPSWVEYGIAILEERPSVLVVSPNDGSDERYTQNMSQQLFLARVATLRTEPLDLSWNGKFDAPGGPMQEYYFMLEGRIGRLLTTKGFYRYVLRKEYRYWHFNPWDPEKDGGVPSNA